MAFDVLLVGLVVCARQVQAVESNEVTFSDSPLLYSGEKG